MMKKTLPRPSFEYEQAWWNKGFTHVVGMDEVGRGAFAGPLVAAAVVLPMDFPQHEGVNDSKLLSATKREVLAEIIKQKAISFAIVEVSVAYINTHGLGKAGELAFITLAAKLLCQSESSSEVSEQYEEMLKQVQNDAQQNTTTCFLIDAFLMKGFSEQKQQAIIKGDQKSFSIAAASILAKVYRDELMSALGSSYERYNFKKHKGYGTAEHRAAIKQYGLCDLHRTSFDLSKFV